MKRITIVLSVVVCMFVVAAANAGPKWEMGDDAWMKIAFLGQAHYSDMDGPGADQDFYLRRGRIILLGQMTDGVKFFMETDNDKAGKAGTTVSTDIQDAFIDLQIAGSDHWVEAGMILLPFSFESCSSAAKLLGIDYNAETIKFQNTFVWRDMGAMLHGSFGSMLAYRVGVFDGYDAAGSTKNPNADLRYTGHVSLNLIGDVNKGWFHNQNRLSEGNYLSIGTGIDTQSKASLIVTEADPVAGTMESSAIFDQDAWVADFQSGFTAGPVGVTLNGAYYDWDNAAFKGTTAFAETGLLVGQTMLTGKYAAQGKDAAEDVIDYTVGLHYFLKGHNARGGIEYRWGDSSDWTLLGLQFLL